MARLDQSFDINELPEAAEYDNSPIPAGDYTATIHSAEVKATKDGMGQMIKLRLDITGPTHTKRVVFTNLNVRSQSQQAEAIAKAQLRKLMQIAGIAQLADTDQLVGLDVGIKVSIRPAKDGYDASNDVKDFKPVSNVSGGGAPTGMPSFAKPPAAQQASAPAAPARSAPPWAAKKG